jgi:hypothetical protein
MIALVLGGSDGVWRERDAALALCTPDIVIATNHAGRDYRGEFDHWASFHAELFPHWIRLRAEKGLPPHRGGFWTAAQRAVVKGLELRRCDNWGGSSGLLAITVALELGASRVIAAGVPLDRDAAHYDNPRPWQDAGNYRRAWINAVPKMGGKVRSMSGWTRETLGEPTEEWISAAP